MPGPSRPPLQPGNKLAVKHGANSTELVDPVAAQVIAEALESRPDLAAPEYRPALLAWGRAEGQAVLVGQWLEDHGPLDDRGRPRPATNLQHQAETRAARLRSELGLTPLSAAKLAQLRAAARQPAHYSLIVMPGDEPQEPARAPENAYGGPTPHPEGDRP